MTKKEQFYKDDDNILFCGQCGNLLTEKEETGNFYFCKLTDSQVWTSRGSCGQRISKEKEGKNERF